MDYHKKTLEELSVKATRASQLSALVGFDGFIDRIMDAVDKRNGPLDDYTPFKQISDFGQRVNSAAGMSTNIELYQKTEKLGGNGPIMANALHHLGLKTRYLGTLGYPEIHPIFEEFAKRTEAVSVANPGVTQAVEFEDGKIMLGDMGGTYDFQYEHVLEVMGEGTFFDLFSRAQLIGLVNWTMLPYCTQFYMALLDKVLPNLPQCDRRDFFFDLADPDKRTDSDLRTVLSTIGRFSNHGHVTLGLNLKEGQRVHHTLGLGACETHPNALRDMCDAIRRKVGIECVVIHPTDGAACATKMGTWYTKGPFCGKPKLSTGAGDHFNSGFSLGLLLGLSPECALTMAVATSGYYVRNAKSPSIADVQTYISSWS